MNAGYRAVYAVRSRLDQAGVPYEEHGGELPVLVIHAPGSVVITIQKAPPTDVDDGCCWMTAQVPALPGFPRNSGGADATFSSISRLL